MDLIQSKEQLDDREMLNILLQILPMNQIILRLIKLRLDVIRNTCIFKSLYTYKPLARNKNHGHFD